MKTFIKSQNEFFSGLDKKFDFFSFHLQTCKKHSNVLMIESSAIDGDNTYVEK